MNTKLLFYFYYHSKTNMDLIVESETYSPSINENGNYIDKLPSFHSIKGIYCACGARKDKLYETYSVFSAHTKTKSHQKWLENLNLNKANYYAENEKLKATIQNQRLIIAKLEKDNNRKTLLISCLTAEMHAMNPITTELSNEEVNLLDFD